MMKRRTRLLVLSEFQKWFLINFIGYTLVFLGLFALGLFLYFKFVAQELMQMGGLLSTTFLELIQKHMMWGFWFLLFLVFALVGLAAYQALFFSRRIAGPIFALSRHLETCLDEKRLKPLKLRDDDLFHEVAERFNRVVERSEGTLK